MTYKFVCPNCNKRIDVNMSIKEYKPNGHYCECGIELLRDYTDIAGNAIWKCDGAYGKQS